MRERQRERERETEREPLAIIPQHTQLLAMMAELLGMTGEDT